MPESVQQQVIELVRRFGGRIPDERWHGCLELAQAGEEGLALENLVDNLCDMSAPVSEFERRNIARLAEAMGIPADRVAIP